MLVDDTLKRLFANRTPWRRRGPRPILSDSEALTLEIVGEFRGLNTDSVFPGPLADLLPRPATGRTDDLRAPSRAPGCRRARPCGRSSPTTGRSPCSTVFPLHICRFARAYRCRPFFGEAAYGHDELLKQTYS